MELFREHYSQLFGYVLTIVRNSADAEDVVQQASLILWKKFDEYRPNTNFFGWACVTARFEAMKYLRRERRYRAHFSEAFQLKLAETMAGIRPEVVTSRDLALHDCVQRLPDKQRELILRCFSDSKNVAIVARETGRTTHSIYSSLRNIRSKLLDCVDQSVAQAQRAEK